jgi:hypothetical protein
MPETTSIGCQTHPNETWLKATPKDVAEFAQGASEWWKQHGGTVKAAIRDVMKGRLQQSELSIKAAGKIKGNYIHDSPTLSEQSD